MVVDQAPTILCEQQAQTHWDATNAMELLGTSLADSVKNTAKLVPGAVNYLRSVESEVDRLRCSGAAERLLPVELLGLAFSFGGGKYLCLPRHESKYDSILNGKTNGRFKFQRLGNKEQIVQLHPVALSRSQSMKRACPSITVGPETVQTDGNPRVNIRFFEFLEPSHRFKQM